MRLLICTQAADSTDPILGFFHRWIEEFAKHCDEVIVVAQRTGTYAFPKNVKVFSLGKEKGFSRPKQILEFFKIIWSEKDTYDAVFVHMSPEYILAGGVLWRLWMKKIMLWYTHKDVSMRLRAATYLADIVATASKESFRLASDKVRVVGHGIDTELFHPGIPTPGVGIRILTVGRMSATKRIMEMLAVLDELHAREKSFSATFVGKPMTAEDLSYTKRFEKALAEKPYREKVVMRESVSREQIPALFSQADIFLNFSTTGSLDKAVLEAMAMEVPPVTSNEAFRTMLEPHGLWIYSTEPHIVAETIDHALKQDDSVGLQLRNEVVEHHSLVKLIPTILKELA